MDSGDPFDSAGGGIEVPGAPVHASSVGTAVLERPAQPVPAALPVGAAAPATEEQPAAGKGRRSTGMASGGVPVTIPDVHQPAPSWPQASAGDETYVPDDFDAEDLAEVNRQLNRARARLFRVSARLKDAQREFADTQLAYERAMRRQLVALSGGTEGSRRAAAEIYCEELENAVVIAKQVAEEWKKRSLDARDDLKTVEVISHNARALMDIVAR